MGELVHFVGDVPEFVIDKGHVRTRVGPYAFSTPIDVFRLATAQQQMVLHEHDAKGAVVPIKGRRRRVHAAAPV